MHFELSKKFFNIKICKGQLVHDHCLTMIKDLEKLGLTIQKELQVDLILQSLMDSHSQFIINYHINKLDYTLSELVSVLVITEGTLKSSRGTVLILEQASSKRKSIWKKKKNKPMKKQKKKNRPKKDTLKKAVDKEKCFYCAALIVIKGGTVRYICKA